MSSGCYVYAIADRDTALPAADMELTLVPWRELAAVIGPVANDGARLTMDAVLRHEAVIESVRLHGRALPVRFGTVFRDATSVAGALEERYASLEADLDRLGDKVEMSLTAMWADAALGSGPWALNTAPGSHSPQPTAQSPGARYLQQRAVELEREDALRERATVVARALDHALGACARERRMALAPAPRIAVRAAYLLDSSELDDFRAVFDAVRARQAEVRLLLTGPWPPYSFVDRGAARTH